MKKHLILSIAVLMGALTFTSCNDDDDEKKDPDSTIVDNAKYKDKSYGNASIDACANVVSQLEAANQIIATASLTSEQEDYLRNTLTNLVNNVIVPTYTALADDVEDLEKTLNGLTVNTITQAQINTACNDFKKARENWERSEAFLMGILTSMDTCRNRRIRICYAGLGAKIYQLFCRNRIIAIGKSGLNSR